MSPMTKLPIQCRYCKDNGLSRLYCARRFCTCSSETSTPLAAKRSSVEVTMSPGGSWMTTKTMTEMNASVGIMPSRRRTA